jgi:nitronate monooxygenase
MSIHTSFNEILGIRFPVLMAPMFLVSNEVMMKAAMDAGIVGAFPTLNFRGDGELEQVVKNLNVHRKNTHGSYGVNLIVQRSNPLYAQHLEVCVANKVPFYITSLGSPQETIQKAHAYGAKVFCDVTNLEHAKKCAEWQCDGFIAVGQGAGGHAGPYPLHLLVPSLKKNFPSIPVVAAGGIANGLGMLASLASGADGVSIGTRFIATTEAQVSDEYKDAIIQSGMEDIVMTEKISGTPCNIINTPFAQKIGYKQNFLERWLSKNKNTRKYFKMLVQLKGLRQLEKAVKPGNYQNLWAAGQSVELIERIQSCGEIIRELEEELEKAYASLQSSFSSKR